MLDSEIKLLMKQELILNFGIDSEYIGTILEIIAKVVPLKGTESGRKVESGFVQLRLEERNSCKKL